MALKKQQKELKFQKVMRFNYQENISKKMAK